MNFDNAHQNTTDELELVLEIAGKQVSKGVDADDFIAWFQSSVPDIAPSFSQSMLQADDGSGAIPYWFGRSLWNAMPQPLNRLRPRPLPKPASNGRCPCGSGEKFKKCCSTLPTDITLFESVNLLYYVISAFSLAKLKETEARYIDPHALADVAIRWTQEGQFERALTLLEPVFDKGKKLPKYPVLLLNALLDCWPHNHKRKRRFQLCERLEQHKVTEIACTALQASIAMQITDGEFDVANTRLIKGMRTYPEDVNFAALELLLLLGKGETDNAQRRAEFWVRKLRKMGGEYDEYADNLLSMVESKESPNLIQDALDNFPEFESIINVISSDPILYKSYAAVDNNEDYVLTPSTEIAQLERNWLDNVSSSEPFLTELGSYEEAMPPWEMLDIVLKNPTYINSIDILDDVTQSLDDYVDDIPAFSELMRLLLQRAETLFYGLLTQTEPESFVSVDDWRKLLPSLQVEVPWGFLENRPMLRMMARHIYHFKQRQMNSAAIWMPRAQVLLALNPNDNQGFRIVISTELLCQAQYAECLKLLDRYPDDAMADVIMNRVLALYSLGREDEAATALKNAGSNLREMRKAIKAKHYPKPRDFDIASIYVGSRAEAWIYRQEMLTCWNRSGAIDWLKQQPNPRVAKRVIQQTVGSDSTSEFIDTEDDQHGFDAASLVEPIVESMKPVSKNVMQEQYKALGPHGPWLLGMTMAAALTPGANFAVQRLISPLLERFFPDGGNVVDDESADVASHELIAPPLETFMAWYNHFLCRIKETESKPNKDDAVREWVVGDLSIASLSETVTRMELVTGLVAAIDANPRGWNPIPTDAKNRVLGPLQLMVAVEHKESLSNDSALNNVSFLGSAEDAYYLDEQTCMQHVLELASLALVSRR